jgi:hypothetical protein
MNFIARRVRFAYRQEHKAPASRVFPLLCPTKEYDWINTWRCNLIYSQTGYAEENCVFTTDFPGDGGRDTWVVINYRSDSSIQFVRVNDIRVIRYNITLKDNGDGTSSSEWEQVITGLNEEGNRFVIGLSQEGYAEEKKRLETMLNHYLQTGKPFPSNSHVDK